MKSRPFEQLFSVGTGFCMGFLKSSKTDHNPFLFKNCKYKAKAAQIKRFKRLMLTCIDEKDAEFSVARKERDVCKGNLSRVSPAFQ